MNNQYIGISEYFATGEGVHFNIATGTKEQIETFVGPYFSMDLDFYTFDAMQQALITIDSEHLSKEQIMDDKVLRAAYVLKTHLSGVASFVQQHGFAKFSYTFQYNLA